MEIILLIIAGVVMYYLYNSFQDYMRNPYKADSNSSSYKDEYNIQDTPYVERSAEDKIKDSEYGLIVRILKQITSVDGNICELEKELVSNMLDDIALEITDIENARKLLQDIFDNSEDNLDDLARDFCDLTKGEYKKRLKVVEFLFALSYADGVFDEKEREKIIDVAAIFELNNDDFNKIYDDYENLYSNNIEVSMDRALELLELDENYTKDELEIKYREKIKENKQNILLNKNLNKDFNSSFKVLREIDIAYKILGEKFK